MEHSQSSESQNPNIRLSFEVGHCCEDVHTNTSPAGHRLLTYDWQMWVRSANGYDISSIVQKVVFKIRPLNALASTIKVLNAAPYIIKGSDSCSVNIKISIFIKITGNSLNKIKLKYYVDVKKHKKRSVTNNRVHYDFVDPSVEEKERLLMCGGEVLVGTGVSVAPLTVMMNMMEM